MQSALIYPNPNLQCLVQISAGLDQIVARTFTIHAANNTGARHDRWVMPAADVAAALNASVTPAAITRATPHGTFLRISDLRGMQVLPVSGAGIVLSEIAQTALTPDAALLGSGACSERAEWVVYAESDGQLHAPINRTLQGYVGRTPKTALYGQLRRNSVLTVLMPFRDSDFSRATIYVKANPAIGVIYAGCEAFAVDVDGVVVGGLPPRPASMAPFRWPGLRLTAPAQLKPDGFAEIAVQLIDGHTGQPIAETGPQVYLESHAGYLPKRRITLVDGIAMARVGALGLGAGDRLHLKAGWRYYPGLAEAEIDII